MLRGEVVSADDIHHRRAGEKIDIDTLRDGVAFAVVGGWLLIRRDIRE